MGIVGSERVFKVLDTKDFIKDNGNVIKDQIEGTVKYKNVKFSYNDDNWVLKMEFLFLLRKERNWH